MLEILVGKLSEIPMFDGIYVNGEACEENIVDNILRFADDYKKDLDFQIMVSTRRKTLRMQQKEALENEELES
jgi:hypothetical protein